MFSYLIKCLWRRPLPALGVLIFSAVVSAVLCALHAGILAETRNYERTYDDIPVEVSVTDLSGTKADRLQIPGWVLELFTGEGKFQPDISEFVSDIQIKLRQDIEDGTYKELVGISGLSIAKELSKENGGSISWYPGYDETVFSTDEWVCVLPESKAQDQQKIPLRFTYRVDEDTVNEFECVLTVAGTYRSSLGDIWVFCPLEVTEQVFRGLEKDRSIDAVSTRVTDNSQLEALRERAGLWFAQPDPTGAKTEWGYGGHEYYLFALDINDRLLKDASLTLENSIFINTLCTYLVFLLSAGAGFFISLLMIRQRKREITLMRSLGTGSFSVFSGIFLEQAVLAVAGILLGGACFRWEPADRLEVFAGVYLLGLILALSLYLRNRLLTAAKEDE